MGVGLLYLYSHPDWGHLAQNINGILTSEEIKDVEEECIKTQFFTEHIKADGEITGSEANVMENVTQHRVILMDALCNSLINSKDRAVQREAIKVLKLMRGSSFLIKALKNPELDYCHLKPQVLWALEDLAKEGDADSVKALIETRDDKTVNPCVRYIAKSILSDVEETLTSISERWREREKVCVDGDSDVFSKFHEDMKDYESMGQRIKRGDDLFLNQLLCDDYFDSIYAALKLIRKPMGYNEDSQCSIFVNKLIDLIESSDPALNKVAESMLKGAIQFDEYIISGRHWSKNEITVDNLRILLKDPETVRTGKFLLGLIYEPNPLP